MKNMTKEQLEEILSKVWMRDWSADDAIDAIWGESFDGYTQPIPEEPKSPTAWNCSFSKNTEGLPSGKPFFAPKAFNNIKSSESYS